MTFADRLREKREAANMTQEQLAGAVMVSRQAVSNWECGKIEPDIDTLTRIAVILNIEIRELMINITLKDKIKRLDWTPHGETVPLYEEFIASPIEDDYAVFKLVICLMYEGEYEKVCKIASAYGDHRNGDVLFFYAAACDLLGEREKALALYKELLDKNLVSGSVFSQFGIEPFCVEFVETLLEKSYSPETVKEFYDSYKRMKNERHQKLLIQPFYYVDTSSYPAFTYDIDAPELKLLREKYALDGVAGCGDELSRIKNLMSWVHKTVGWDGCNGIKAKPNALSILEKAISDGTRFNCRGVGIVLSEVYLAMGYKSKFVVCLPFDKKDNDCHIITHVYSETKKKWMMFDACYESWAEDERGNILSIPEIRYRYEKNLLVVFPETVNANGSPGTYEDYKQNYLKKNFYRFECPQNSGFGAEDRDDLYMAALEPGEYADFLGYRELPNPNKRAAPGNHLLHLIKTSNPDWFFMK